MFLFLYVCVCVRGEGRAMVVTICVCGVRVSCCECWRCVCDVMPCHSQVVEARVDHTRVVDIMRRAGQLPLVKDYLASVQKNNLLAVS